MKARLQHPMYTAAALAAANPVLLKGEVVYESDTHKHKIGDGTAAWNALPYEDTERPDTIPASAIVQTAEERMVSDAQIAAWNGKAAADLSNATVTKSLATRGYYKAPDGLLLQWGAEPQGLAALRTISFPISFYTTPFAIVCTATPISSTEDATVAIVIKSKSLSYFTANVSYSVPSDGGLAKEGFNWLAIGRWR